MTTYQESTMKACESISMGSDWLAFAEHMIRSEYIFRCHMQNMSPDAVATSLREAWEQQ